jgi:L-seryl-tRNA(Ser) seleniumtransferase
MYPRLPSVEHVLRCDRGQDLLALYARPAVVAAVRGALEALRARIRAGEGVGPTDVTTAAVAERAAVQLADDARPRTRRVVNATGVILHTNLGRALLADEVVEAVAAVASESCALEYDVATGRRGDRDVLVEEHLRALTGAEAATVVNNNAAAVLLALSALAAGREVVVSRGELIEIGGSFRIPEIMARSGAILREVGTTNRTHASDYENAIAESTAMLLKVHTSNYRIVGFTAAVELESLRAIADRHRGVMVMEDLGAGALVDLAPLGLEGEPVVADRVARGADVVTFSGDKLLGGPQCGVIVGRRAFIDRVRRDPLKRALRCDKMTLAALEATLRIYRFDPDPPAKLPTLRALARPLRELDELGAAAVDRLSAALGPGFHVRCEASVAQAGSGSQPTVSLPSRAIVVTSDGEPAERIAARFRSANPPVIGRIERERFLLDLRTIDDPADLVPEHP